MSYENRIINVGEYLSDENQKSIGILNRLQNSDYFRLEKDKVKPYYRNQEGELAPSQNEIPVEDFLSAVDYYYKNRASESHVAEAMQTRGGVVDIYSPHVKGGGDRQVVARLNNHFVPELLEFAYLVVRSSQKETD